MPEPADGLPPAPTTQRRRASRLLVRAPSPPVGAAIVIAIGSLMTVAIFGTDPYRFALGWAFVFVGPALLAALLTTPLVAVLGGRLELHRGLFLSLTTLALQLPLALAWQGASVLWPQAMPPLVLLGPFLAAPAFWFRQLTLYGVARPRHATVLAGALAQPLALLAGFFVLEPATWTAAAAALVLFLIAFGCAVLVLRSADRPIRREFHRSGVSLIRPLLDHVGGRDPAATERLESFFRDASVRADLRVRELVFYREGSAYATWVLPTVHPGPFGALGASDLPRKLSEALGAEAGTVLVPHTPSDHDLDLPSGEEVRRLAECARTILRSVRRAPLSRSSRLVEPRTGSTVRAQVLGDSVLVVASQAPAPTDDIAFSVADRIVRDLQRDGTSAPLLVDAHNSYVEGQGDIAYGSPAAERLTNDALEAVRQALAAASDGPVEVGVSRRAGYSIGEDGIGPAGIAAFAVRAGGRTTGYVLIDGNNLVVGARATILAELRQVVDDAEVLTTDNHVVHEVDGGVNPVGERYPPAAVARDARATLEAAVRDLAPAEVGYGEDLVRDVPVLGPNYTARLLTSLGDTLSMFTHIFPASLGLLLTSSLVITLLLR